MKTCTNCQIPKPLAEFSPKTAVCKQCRRALARIHTQALVERVSKPSDKLYVNQYRGDTGREYVSAMTYGSIEEAETAMRNGAPRKMEWLGVCELSKPIKSL